MGPAMADEQLDLPKDVKPDPEHPERALGLSANRKYFKGRRVLQADYRDRLAGMIPYANQIELYLLDFELPEKSTKIKEEESFPILPYQKSSRILKRAKLKGDTAKECKLHFGRLLRTREDFGGGAWCHFPIHGVRFHKDDDYLFGTSICWACSNYYIQYPDDPDDSATWVGLSDEGLETFLKRQMPVPESELKRFKEQHPELAK
jgi:hypothetical protein